LKHRNLWVACGVGFVLLVIYLSVTPHPVDVPSWHGLKLGHIAAYGWLMLWFTEIFPRAGARIAIAAALLALGIGLEYVQDMVGRDFAYSDMRDDGIGIAFGWILALTPLGRILGRIDA